MRHAWVDGARVALAPARLVGQGGEAEVYDLGDGRVLKWWKPPDHPDFDGLPDAQAAAAHRLAERPAKLRALPANLPAAVVAPSALATDRGGRRVVGYVMPKVDGEPLHAYGEPRWRRDHPVAGDDVIAILLALHDALAALHRAGVVVGDCNDLNVLVGGRAVHLIDVDSYQFAGFACAMVSERFVDPRLLDGRGAWVGPHDADSDWFAFAIMAVRTLLGVGPWGGVHQPADPTRRCSPGARAARRISIFDREVVYPRAARPIAILPDAVVELLRAIFERDRRGVFPRAALEGLHLRACGACGELHARVRCPGCQTRAAVPPAVIHGRLRWSAIDPAEVALPYEVGAGSGARGPRPIWLAGGALWRPGALGPERIGAVLAGQTRAWVGARLGAGFYRAGGYAVGFVFRPDRGPLDDRVALPRIRGRLIDAHATIGDDRAWLWLVTDAATTCVVIGADARVIACDDVTGAPWLPGIHGACAAGAQLFVPTDDGVARVELVQDAVVHTRTFPETRPLVTSSDRLALAAGGLDVRRGDGAIRMHLT